MAERVVIGTRGSRLALWQAAWVKSRLETLFPGLAVRLEVIKTQGDRILDVPLARVGGKGLFVKEIEEALRDGRADLAVHSMKDVPAEIPEGLAIGAVPPREDPGDVLIGRGGARLGELAAGSRVGTSSLRRAAQLRHLRPDLTVVPVRGNVDTRLSKLERGEVDALLLAAAGLERLGLAARVSERLDTERMLPAVGQGALCIEIRRDDPRIGPLVAALDHPETRTAVTAERAFLRRLEGGCQVPIAGHACREGGALRLEGLVAQPDGAVVVRGRRRGAAAEAAEIGRALAEELLARGADRILTELYCAER